MLNDTINANKNFSLVALATEEEPDDNPDISLENFNKYSGGVSDSIGCGKSQDKWVHSEIYCGSDFPVHFQSTDPYTKDLGNKICFDPSIAISTQDLRDDRYNNVNFGACVEDNPFFSNYQSILIAYYSAHKNYVISLIESMNKLQKSVNQFEGEYDQYNTELLAFLE